MTTKMPERQMSTSKGAPSRLMRDMAASADYLHSIGGMDAETHRKITLRDLKPDTPSHVTEMVTPEDVRRMREQLHMSQAVFARHLNVSVGYISQIERGSKRPVGTALALFNVMRRKGPEAIL